MLDKDATAYMLSDSVETEALEHLQIRYHGFSVGRRMESVRPEALIERAEDEGEFSVQQRSLHPLDLAARDGAESGVAGYFVITQCHCQIIQRWRRWRPQLWLLDLESELLVRRPVLRRKGPTILADD